MTAPLHVHVPTPGDHFSPSTGSAPMTIIYELARAHARHGGRTRIVVGRGTRADYPVGECVKVGYGPLPSTRRKLADALAGRVGLPRAFGRRVYAPAAAALGDDASIAFVHNSVVGAALVKERRPDVRTYLYAHNDLWRTYGRREARRTLERLDGVICVSDFLAGVVRSLAPAAKVAGVRNGVDLERFRPAEAEPNGAPTILFVGRIVPEKGCHLLVEAAKLLAARGLRFRLRIVGSHGFSATDALSAYERGLRESVRALGDAVEFVPFVDRGHVLHEYQSASIFCAPSVWNEPCSLTVPEALACGLPTVTTRRGGLTEVGGDAALYFDPPDVTGLVDHLALLLEDPSARAEWGKRARRHAQSLSWWLRYEELSEVLGA